MKNPSLTKLFLLSLVLVVLSAGSASAAKNTFGVAWNVSLPIGDASDHTSGLQFRGATLEWRNFYTRDMAYGINASWDVFTESFEGTFEGDNFALTGKSWRYLNAVPIYASWHKYSGGDKRSKRPFFGINAGTAYIHRRTEVGVWQQNQDNWHLAIAPELGLRMPWDSFVGWASLRYNYAFSAGDVDAQQWLEFRIGFGMD